MKLSCVLLAAIVAVTVADTEYYQQGYHQTEDVPNYYYGHRRQSQSALARLVSRLFGNGNRRQFTAPGTGGGGGGVLAGTTGGLGFVVPVVVIVGGVVLAAVAAAALASSLNSSGRGLDTDEWEVDHSVWMNQLQKDFEDSWSTE